MFRRVIATLVILYNFFVAGPTHALEMEQIAAARDTIIEMCRGGKLQGEARSYKVETQGNIKTVIIKKLVEAGIDGKATFEGRKMDCGKGKPLRGIHTMCQQKFSTNIRGARISLFFSR